MGWGNKNLLNGSGHMTKMAAMPIYGKNLKKNLLLQNPKVDDLETWLEYYLKTVQMMTLGWPWPILRQCQI